jgi:protein SCO1/2
VLLAVLAAAVASRPALAQDPRALAQIRGVDIDEHLGRTLPLELTFTTSEGRQVQLGDYFKPGNTRPAVITLVYYNCPVVCDVFLAKTAGMMNDIDYTVGRDYNALVFSFGHDEPAPRAAEAKAKYLATYGRRGEAGVSEGWAFHASDEAAARQLADALGFKYRRMPDGNYSHPVCKFIVTPDGKVSRYLYGYEQDPRDFRLALMEASQGKLVATVGDRIMSYCYLYDPATGKYTLRAVRVMQVGGLLTLAGLATLITMLFVGERVRRRLAASRTGASPSETTKVVVSPAGLAAGSRSST